MWEVAFRKRWWDWVENVAWVIGLIGLALTILVVTGSLFAIGILSFVNTAVGIPLGVGLLTIPLGLMVIGLSVSWIFSKYLWLPGEDK